MVCLFLAGGVFDFSNTVNKDIAKPGGFDMFYHNLHIYIYIYICTYIYIYNIYIYTIHT